MNPTYEQILRKMLEAGGTAFGANWGTVEKYAKAEFKKIAKQLVDILDNVAKFKVDPNTGYSETTARHLLRMQITATESVIVAMTALTLLAVEAAINAILNVLEQAFTAAFGTLLAI